LPVAHAVAMHDVGAFPNTAVCPRRQINSSTGLLVSGPASLRIPRVSTANRLFTAPRSRRRGEWCVLQLLLRCGPLTAALVAGAAAALKDCEGVCAF
jgi:hypothetical protein